MNDATTVVVAVLNQQGYTKCCLDAIIRHSPPDTKVIIWDNGSVDPIRELCSFYPSDRILYHRSEVNLGVPEAYNQCVNNLVNTDKVCFLHNDVIVTPEWLDRLSEHLDGQKSSSVICPRTNYCDKTAFRCGEDVFRRACEQKPPNKGIRISDDVVRTALSLVFGRDGLDGFAASMSAKAFGTARSAVELGDFCFLMRTETVRSVGGFEERLGPHLYWDCDFRDRLDKLGYGIRIADDVFVHHHGNLTSDGPGFNFRALQSSNRKKYEKFRREGKYGDGTDMYRVEMDDKSSSVVPDIMAFTPYYVPGFLGGAERSLHVLLKGCVEFGVPVEVHCFLDDKGEKIQYQTETFVDDVRVVRHAHCDEIRFADIAKRLVSDRAPRAVLFQGDRVKCAAVACAETESKSRLSWFFRNMDEVERPDTFGIPMRKVVPNMRGTVFANSQFLADRVREEYGVQCVVALPQVGHEWRTKTERSHLTCMAATEEKGIRIVMRIAERMPGEKFLVAGHAPPDIAAALAEISNIEYVGPVKDPLQVYRKTRILLVPSQIHDSSPRVVLESHATGIPVIGTDRGGIKEMIGRGGICLPVPCDERDFVGAIKSLEDNKSYKRCAKLASENFDKYNRNRGQYLFRSAITSSLRDKEARAHEGTVSDLIKSLSRCDDPFRLVRTAYTEKTGLNRIDAMEYVFRTLLSLQSDAVLTQVLDAAAKNFGNMIESVRSIPVRQKLGSLRILVTMKPRSGGGGVLTVLNLVRGLREAGHDAHFVEVGNVRELICRVDGVGLPKRERTSLYKLLLRDRISSPMMRTILRPDIVVFDDVDRIWEPEVLNLAHIDFFLLCCGIPGVHTTYYTKDWILNPKKIKKFKKVFVRNLSYYRYLNDMANYDGAYENRIVSWQGGCDYEALRQEFGRCQPPSEDGVLRMSTFSKWEWWKGPSTNMHAAIGVNRMLKNRDVRWYVPIAWQEHIYGSKNGGLKLEYGIRHSKSKDIIAQNEVLIRMRSSHVGMEMAFSDAFPRSVNEATNLGLPVIVSSAIEHTRVNSDYEELCVVENPNDMLGAAQKARRLLTDRDAWMAASQAALEIGKEYHSSREAEVFIREANLPQVKKS